jgi:hypothetical protein
MLRCSAVLYRRGQARPATKLIATKHPRVPQARRPHQGGQQWFNYFQLARKNSSAANKLAASAGMKAQQNHTKRDIIRSPLGASTANIGVELEEELVQQIQTDDQFVTSRGYNELDALEKFEQSARTQVQDIEESPKKKDVIPEAISTNEYFQSKFGYSLLKSKSSKLPSADMPYSQLDLWAEQPKYGQNTYFLYLVARRRNAYAVIYDYGGKRILPTYSAGNRGLKNSDKGFKSDGSQENAHVVTSQYLNDAIPRIYEREVAARRMKAGEQKKIEIVVRVLGFYNARAGAIRAVKDRQDVLEVKHFEDITPFPLNGPRMPKAAKRS